ncbi:glycine rich domain-containing protein [Clostridioides difficile]|uniref:glycine rich domain-containing protein n=1 Tax=Clostridioides difficile TaxID=1496 RepID=UPI000B043E38|nr:glycine rich domain-containing protein [Clostridioides difficile]
MAIVYEFNYTGAEQSVVLPPGKYKFECFGACGGNYYDFVQCAKGGYTAGSLILKENTTLHVYVGQSGYCKGVNGIETCRSGFNGAGGITTYKSTSDGYYSLAGGGATDIRLIGGNWDNLQSLLSRIIVAGGGGGGSGNSHDSIGHGGGTKGKDGISIANKYFAGGGSQFQGGLTFNSLYNGSFGVSGAGDGISGVGGGGGWYCGAGSFYAEFGGGGSGYILTKDSYKPANYSPSSKYYFSDINSVVGGNTTKQDGYAKITLLQALPFLTISSYNSTTATFKADHTDPTLLTKIEYFIDDVLKETITIDLTTEKIINYTLEDNALHTLKIVVTDSANATAEKVVSISKGIAPLPAGSTTDEVTSKWIEIKDTFKSGKTSIINTLALKNIEASLNNTLVELSEKIKTSFDSSDASVQDLMNQLTQANNTITQLNTKYKVASGTVTPFKGDDTKIAYPYLTDRVFKPSAWVKISNLDFKPNIFFADFDYYDTEYKNNYKLFLFACCGVATQRGVDFSSVTSFVRKSSDEYFHANGWLYNNSEGDVYFNNTGVQIPAYSFDSTQRHIYKWYAIKFI